MVLIRPLFLTEQEKVIAALHAEDASKSALYNVRPTLSTRPVHEACTQATNHEADL